MTEAARKTRSIERSLESWGKARHLIPAGTQTFSKGPNQFAYGVSPIYLERGAGSHVWDVDGNEYIDYIMALGPVTLGYAYPAVDRAVKAQLEKGVTFSLMHPLELKLAEVLHDIVPCAEMVRYGKNGSDVTAAAVRLARAYTGRDIVACCGYHGWQDWYVGTTTRNKGVPEAVRSLTVTFEYNNVSQLETIFRDYQDQVAAVIMEPVGVVEPVDGFLAEVRDLTHQNGALLVFDEIVTGFRLSLGGAQELYGVVPDLACFGKGIANGLPLSVLAGKRQYMELLEDVFFSFTFGGECLSLAAALATVREMQGMNVVDHFWKQGRKLKEGYNAFVRRFGIAQFTECIGLPPRTLIKFMKPSTNRGVASPHSVEWPELKTLFIQETAKRGILTNGGQNICLSHTDGDIERTLGVYEEVLAIMADAIESDRIADFLESAVVQPVFRRW